MFEINFFMTIVDHIPFQDLSRFWEPTDKISEITVKTMNFKRSKINLSFEVANLELAKLNSFSFSWFQI